MSISKSNSIFLKLGLVLAILTAVVFGFAACGGLGALKDNPSADDAVIGNGGLAVQKGDYLYFVNGYIDTSSVADTNHYGNIDHSAIYRIKLVDGKVVETNPEYTDEDGNQVKDKTLALNNLDILVPKVAGFEYSNLYIFGDYLYYATPNYLKDDKGQVRSNYLHIYRVHLNRSGANELVYSSEAETSNVSFTMFELNGVVYQIILDDEKLVLNTIKNGKITVTTISEDAHEVSLPKYSNSTDAIADIDKKIYFTQHSDDFSGTILYAYDLASGQTQTIFSNPNVTYKIINTSGNYLYYVKTDANAPSYGAKIYTMNTKFQESDKPISNQIVDDGIKSYYLSSPYLGTGIIYSDGSSTFFKKSTDTASIKVLSSDVVSKIVKVSANYMFYIANSNLYKIDYTVADQTAQLVIPAGDTPKSDIVNNFDVDGQNIYYFVKHNENYYMHYVTYDPSVTTDEGDIYSHFVGKLLKADYSE